MTLLASRAEALKLACLLDQPEPALADLAVLPPEALRHVRLAVADRCLRHHAPLLQRLARLVRWLPPLLVAWLVRHRLSPLLTARLAGFLPAARVAQLALRLDTPLLADIAARLDPRAARDLVRLLPQPRLLGIADVLLARRDFITLGRFVAIVPDEVVSEVAARIPDEADLLQIVYCLDSVNRLDHIVRQLPPERIERAVLLIADPASRPIWPQLLSLVAKVSRGLQQQLGDLAAAQGDEVLEAIIAAGHEENLWQDLLTVVVNLTPALQARVVNLPGLRQQPVLRGIIQATLRSDLWADVMDLVEPMTPEGRDQIALAIADLPGEAIAPLLHGALLRARWPVLFDILRRLPSRHAEVIRELRHYQSALDPIMAGYLDEQLAAHGIAA